MSLSAEDRYEVLSLIAEALVNGGLIERDSLSYYAILSEGK